MAYLHDALQIVGDFDYDCVYPPQLAIVDMTQETTSIVNKVRSVNDPIERARIAERVMFELREQVQAEIGGVRKAAVLEAHELLSYSEIAELLGIHRTRVAHIAWGK